MKIGINSRIYQEKSSGIQQYIENLYKHCIQLDKGDQFIFFQTAENKKIGVTKTIPIGSSLIKNFLFDNFLVNKMARRERVEIFHGPSNILPFFKVKGIKYVVTIHDLSFLFFTKNHSRLFNFYYKYFIGRSLKNADAIVAISENTKSDIVKYYKIPEEKIKTIYHGIDHEFIASVKNESIEEKYFFSVTTHPIRKNINSVIKVMAQNDSLREYKYKIAGLMSDENRQDLMEEIKKNNLEKRVQLVGYLSREELVKHYRNAAFFIFPSFYEGFGLPVLEAMACGCPVITSANSSLIEITPEKKWLVDPYSLEDISKKIDSMLSLSKLKRKKLIADNKVFSSKFNWDNTANQMVDVFKNIN